MHKDSCGCGSGKSHDDCCGSSCGVNLVEHAMKSSHEAFMKAHQNALETRMRKKIEEAFGSKLDEVVDVTFEAISKMWKSMIDQSNDKSEVEIQLQKIFSSKD